MPKRHGLYRLDDKDAPWHSLPWFLVGINEVFHAAAYQTAIPDPTGGQAVALTSHFSHIQSRLVYTLDLFQQSVAEWGEYFDNEHDEPCGQSQLVNVAADSLPNYINILLDDVARIVPFVFDRATFKPVESFSHLKAVVSKSGKYSSIKPLFDKLSDPGSWWDLLLARGHGVRQRVVHYTDLIRFQAMRGPNDDRHTVQAFIHDGVTPTRSVEFIGTLRSVLNGMCNWLDDLELALAAEQAAQFTAIGATRPTMQGCPRLLLPIERRWGTRIIPDDFLYLPLCDGSRPSACEFTTVRSEKGIGVSAKGVANLPK